MTMGLWVRWVTFLESDVVRTAANFETHATLDRTDSPSPAIT